MPKPKIINENLHCIGSKGSTELMVIVEDAGIRLDLFLSTKILDYSRTYFQKLIKKGNISLNGIVNKTPKTTVSSGMRISIDWPVEQNYEIPQGEDFCYTILFEDNDVIVIDKPPGVVVHPAAGNWDGTIVNALIDKDSRFIDKFANEPDKLALQRPGIVHRLDKDTSGCLVIAKNITSRKCLSASFASRDVKKTYSALSYDVPSKYSDEIATLIGRHPVNRKKMAVVQKNGKEAVTLYKVEKTGKIEGVTVSLLKVNILTGRTHQIRVHLAHIKLPVLGDKVYGGQQKLVVPRQMLHARTIVFPHPATAEMISVTSPYPEDFQYYLNQF
jgi:23S rRNA pseudouridine1911/1915/1917 synthase